MQYPGQQKSLCSELCLKKKSHFQKFIFIRDFDFDYNTYVRSF